MQPERLPQPEVVEVVETVVPEPATLTHGGGEEHIHLSPQSIWPITLAAGITLAGAGLVTSLAITALGVVIMIVSIVYWVQELRHELH